MDNVLLRLALDIGIFNIIVHYADGIDIVTLAEQANVADHTLLRRICRALGAINAIGEVGVDIYKPTNFSRAFTSPKGICGAKFS